VSTIFRNKDAPAASDSSSAPTRPRRRVKKTERPSIPLPNGDTLEPVGRLGQELGMSERAFRAWLRRHRVHVGMHSGCSYVSRNAALATLGASILGETPPKRRRR
jgi:hypothetical protein